jgi:hypothetical protein
MKMALLHNLRPEGAPDDAFAEIDLAQRLG